MPAIALMGAFILSGIAATVGPAHASAPVEETPVLPSYTVTLTGYNAVPGQTDSDPSTTASGAYSNPEIVAARSRDMAEELPFGTVIKIEGPASNGGTCGYGMVTSNVGYRIILDTMNERFRKHIDVLFDTEANYIMSDGRTKNASIVLGSCAGATISVIGRVDLSHLSHLPKTQAELVSLIEHSSLAVR